MAVSFYNFQDLHTEKFQNQIKERLSKIIAENSFIEGEYNQSFEKKFAQMQEAKHCLLVANGTDALEIALQCYDVGPGDKVGVPGITFYATAEAVINRGAEVIFIDIDEKTGLICPNSLERIAKKHKLKAVMPVHIYGLPAPMREIEQVCQKYNIKIVEDAAQAQGALLEGKPIGHTNNLITFSFYPTKNLSAFGDAGAILTQDSDMAEKIKAIRNHGRGKEALFGRNSRCDHMQAAVLDLKLENIEQLNKQRKEVAKKYHHALEAIEEITLLPSRFLESSSWHLYPIRLQSKEKREKLQKYLSEKNIGLTPFYEKALSQEAPLKSYEGEDDGAKRWAGTVICLPMTPFLTSEQIQEVAQAVKEGLKQL